METKKEIRRQIYQKRRELEERVWKSSCKDISDTVLCHPWFLEEKNIFTYVDYNREAETQRIIDVSFRMGKNVWVPKILGKSMLFYRINTIKELRPGAYGIMEPSGIALADKNFTEKEPEADLDDTRGLLIMPGVAFDEKCHRIGYGKGYYDRYLAAHPKLRRMALAFEFQVFPEIPYEEFDICPEILITERRILWRQDCQEIPCFC